MMAGLEEQMGNSVAGPSKIRLHRFFRNGNIHWVILVTLLLSSTSINILLAQRVSTLTNTIVHLKAEGKLKIDTQVPPIEAKDLEGYSVSLPYNGLSPTVLYIFTPQCGWCRRNLQNLKTLSNAMREKYRFIGLSLSQDRLQEYVDQQKFDFPVYSDLPDSVKQAYKVDATPQTIVVSGDGKVLKVWTGAYQEDIQKSVEDYFGVRLPGLVNDN